MIATTRLSMASLSQSMSLPSNGSMAIATFGFFQGSLNSGDWAAVRNEQAKTDAINAKILIIIPIMPEECGCRVAHGGSGTGRVLTFTREMRVPPLGCCVRC